MILNYFKTEVLDDIIVDDDVELGKEDPRIVKAAFDFLENPEAEPDHFDSESFMNEHSYLAESTLPSLRPNYQDWQDRILEIVKRKITFFNIF